MTERLLLLEDGPYRLVLDADLGGHLVEFSIEGCNALAVGKPEIGSTFWPSPQDAWGWPPPQALDKGPYSIDSLDSGVHVSSPECPQTALRLWKHFELLRGCLTATYVMRNCGDKPVQYAPWEITRIGGGMTFYETDQAALPRSTGQLVYSQGVAWHIYNPHQQVQHEKVFGNGSRGWLANHHEGLLLVKQFDPVPAERVAPGEAEVEIYAHGDPHNPYIEIEQQGSYETMAPGGEIRWQVLWHLQRWDEEPNIGSETLLGAVRQILARRYNAHQQRQAL
jgi:hypothetical protein